MVYRIDYSRESIDHLRFLTARQRQMVLDVVDRQLKYQADVQTRNRKLMESNPVAVWELRIDNLRVYYDIEDEPELVVVIRAVGVKERNIVRIGGEEVEL